VTVAARNDFTRFPALRPTPVQAAKRERLSLFIPEWKQFAVRRAKRPPDLQIRRALSRKLVTFCFAFPVRKRIARVPRARAPVSLREEAFRGEFRRRKPVFLGPFRDEASRVRTSIRWSFPVVTGGTTRVGNRSRLPSDFSSGPIPPGRSFCRARAKGVLKEDTFRAVPARRKRPSVCRSVENSSHVADAKQIAS
jgi:hypothetical protein